MRELLTSEAEEFRKVIESIPSNEFSVTCQLHHSYPFAACGDSSMLLGKYLYDHFNIDCSYIAASCLIEGKEMQTHAWIEAEGYKVDITADQFEGVNKRVVVSKDHPFYEWYEPKIIRKISEYFPVELISSYNRIVSEVDKMNI